MTLNHEQVTGYCLGLTTAAVLTLVLDHYLPTMGPKGAAMSLFIAAALLYITEPILLHFAEKMRRPKR
jgi:hypothetical protein